MRQSLNQKSDGEAIMDVERFSKLGTDFLQQGRLQEASEAFTDAYNSSQNIGSNSYMQRACAFNLGALKISLGQFNDGLHYLNLAKPDEGCRDGKSNGDLFFNFGLAYEGLNNHAKSIQFFEKALTEYRSEHSNTKMEADTTQRLGQLCVVSGQFAEAEFWMKQLIQNYDALDDKEHRLQAEAERANLLLKMGKIEEAEEISDDCMKGAKSITSSSIGNVFNELGLVYTQLGKHEKALESSHCALAVLKSPSADQKLVAVLHQNTGALYNYMGRFEEAIEFHSIAIQKHAELKNRKSQGHCFVNLGYAYSQLKRFDKAGESFLHALQAAKDCGDKKSEWQSFEAMGSIAFTNGDLKSAQEYYKLALSSYGQSVDVSDRSIQDRIFGKLSYIIQAQTQTRKSPSVVRGNLSGRSIEEDMKQTDADAAESTPPIQDKSEQVIVVRRGSKIKQLKVRRSGTLRQFKKFALGLDVSRPSSMTRGTGWPPPENMSILSAETLSERDLDGEEGESDSDSESPIRKEKQPPQNKKQREDEEEEESDESGDDVRKVQAEMQRVASLNDAYAQSTGTTGFIRQQVNADVHAQAQDSESDSEEEDSSEEESDEEDSRTKQRRNPPPVPSLSPPDTTKPTNMRTYETPKGDEAIYETIDHHRDNKANEREGKTRRSDEGEASQGPSSQTQADKEDDKSTDFDEDDKEEGLQAMSRAERDIFMYSEFKKDSQKQTADAYTKESDQQKSKHCVVM